MTEEMQRGQMEAAPGEQGPSSEIPAEDYEVQLESLNQWQLAWRKFRRHRLALIGLGILTVLVVGAIIGPIVSPFVFNEIPKPDKIVAAGRPPSLAHPFGETGGLQRDVLQLVVNGARTSLMIGFASMLIGVVIGTAIGAIAGYVGGFVDNVLMRMVDVILSLPSLFVILVAGRFFPRATCAIAPTSHNHGGVSAQAVDR